MARNDQGTASREAIDLRLRKALEPRQETVARIVGAALAGGRPARRLRLVPVASVLAVLLAAAALLVKAPWPADPSRGGSSPAGGPLQASISIENVGDVLVVRSRDRRPSLVSRREPGGRPSPSGSLIVVYGD